MYKLLSSEAISENSLDHGMFGRCFEENHLVNNLVHNNLPVEILKIGHLCRFFLPNCQGRQCGPPNHPLLDEPPIELWEVYWEWGVPLFGRFFNTEVREDC